MTDPTRITFSASLAFVELTVRDLDDAIQWYREVLGLREAMRETDTFAMLIAGTMRLALKRGTPSPAGVLLAFEVSDLEEWVRRITVIGVRLEDGIRESDEGYRRVRLRDADGYAISIFEWVVTKGDGTDAQGPVPSQT